MDYWGPLGRGLEAKVESKPEVMVTFLLTLVTAYFSKSEDGGKIQILFKFTLSIDARGMQTGSKLP